MNQPVLQIYLRPRMTLTFDLLTTRVDRPMPLTRGPLMSIFIKIGSFVFKISCYNLVTDGRTDGQTENIMPPPVSLDWSRHKIQWYSSNLHGDYKVTLLIQTRSEYHISCHSETGRIYSFITCLLQSLCLSSPSSVSIIITIWRFIVRLLHVAATCVVQKSRKC